MAVMESPAVYREQPIATHRYRDDGHFSIDTGYDLDRACHRFSTAAPNLFSQGSRACTNRVDTCQTLPKRFPTSTTFLHRRLLFAIITIRRLHVHTPLPTEK